MTSVLVVEDCFEMRELLTLALAGHGYSTLVAEDGVQALSLAKNTDIDLLVTDIYMPNMDGIKLMKQIREIERYRELPMLAFSSDDDRELEIWASKAGASQWFVKPIDIRNFLASVKKLLPN